MKIDYEQYSMMHPTLRGLLLWFEKNTGVEFTATSIYRSGDPGVHGAMPCRGVDLRCRNEGLGLYLQDMINGRATYDPNRPEMKCCLLHGEGSNMHLHVQVHPNTVFVG